MSSAHAASAGGVEVLAEPLESLLRRDQVARVFNVSPRTVTYWAQTGKLRSVRTPGGQRRYPRSEVVALLKAAENENEPAGAPHTGRAQ